MAHISEKLRKEVEELRMIHETSTIGEYVTISLGCATVLPKQDDDPTSVIHSADKALYMSKQSGRNRITIAEA